MRISKRTLWLASFMLVASSVIACSSGSDAKHPVDRQEWKLVFAYDGADMELPLEKMEIYLVEEEQQYPEVFEITGSGVTLVGTFPMDCHVGYEENWPVLMGRTITVAASGGARDDMMSYVQMPDGGKAFVVGGSLVPEKIAGKIDGMDGNRTVSGTFVLRVRTGLGEEELTGRFAVHCYTLG